MIHYYDKHGKLRKFDKTKDYHNNTNSIRLKFMEKPYRFWRNLNSDIRNSIIPLGLSFIMSYTIYAVKI